LRPRLWRGCWPRASVDIGGALAAMGSAWAKAKAAAMAPARAAKGFGHRHVDLVSCACYFALVIEKACRCPRYARIMHRHASLDR